VSQIKILPEIVANKIAAGEVVERPASVVKELVENAIDAGSKRITIEIEKGGRSLIRVSDNGMGMSRDDALLAIERFATSKIYDDSDIFSIGTLGFRGEALPSIASVSNFSVITKNKDSEAGTHIVIDGGVIKKVADAGAPVGTMITVKQLFYNTPARRKFLKSVNTEMGHIADTVSCIALGWPEIQFRLFHNGKAVKQWADVSDSFDRVVDILGNVSKNDLHEIEFKEEDFEISGWTSDPSLSRSTSSKIYFFVNGRYIRDRLLQHALFEGYGGRLMKGRFPLAVIFIQVPFDRIDVNVHPTKHEVRFADQNKVYETIKQTVLKIWQKAEHPGRSYSVAQEDALFQNVKNDISNSFLNERKTPFESTYTSKTSPQYKKERAIPPTQNTTSYEKKKTVIQPEVQTTLWESTFLGSLNIIGQFDGTYILCESEEGLVIIDQHVAHERILLEQMKKRACAKESPAQKLLIPETIELGYKETPVLEKMIPDLNQLGLEIEPFGGNTFVVKSVPALLTEKEIKPLVIELVEKMESIGFTPELESAIDECLILMACHGAIRAHHRLSHKEMKHLVEQLDECDNPAHCPHGRPIWIKWSMTDLEKSFKRIV